MCRCNPNNLDGISQGRLFGQIELHVLHLSLPECKMGEEWPLIPLIPMQNGIRYWYKDDKLMMEEIK